MRKACWWLAINRRCALRLRVLSYRLVMGLRLHQAGRGARQLIAQRQFVGAVVAPAGLATGEGDLLRELQVSVPRLAVLTDDADHAKRLAVSLPGAMLCRSKPLEHEKLLAFLNQPVPLGFLFR